MRPEIRIIKMTETEYEAAMKQFLVDYEDEINNYWDFLMIEFREFYESNMEIAYGDVEVVYAAIITDDHGRIIEDRIYELPVTFDPDKFKFTAKNLDFDYGEGD